MEFESNSVEELEKGENADSGNSESAAAYHIEKIKEAALKFFIKERIPLAKLNSKYFNQMLSICLKKNRRDHSNFKLMSRKSGRARIQVVYRINLKF